MSEPTVHHVDVGAMVLRVQWEANARRFAADFRDYLTGRGPYPASPLGDAVLEVYRAADGEWCELPPVDADPADYPMPKEARRGV